MEAHLEINDFIIDCYGLGLIVSSYLIWLADIDVKVNSYLYLLMLFLIGLCFDFVLIVKMANKTLKNLSCYKIYLT